MTEQATQKSILICDTQPVSIEGIRWLLNTCTDLRFAGAVCSLQAAFELAKTLNPAVVLIDKALGMTPIIEWLHRAGASNVPTNAVVWGVGIAESEALRLLQSGVRGLVRRTSETETLVACLRGVADGHSWMEDGIFGDTEQLMAPRRSQLTARERQIVELVEKGLRNRDIAMRLGIQTGTVKIHLKHIFEKTGVRGRYGLALNGLRDKRAIVPAA
jgi:two-component system, NarL family, nitrate/nitrite response regulator NarL